MVILGGLIILIVFFALIGPYIPKEGGPYTSTEESYESVTLSELVSNQSYYDSKDVVVSGGYDPVTNSINSLGDSVDLVGVNPDADMGQWITVEGTFHSGNPYGSITVEKIDV